MTIDARLKKLAWLAAALLITRVTVSVVLGYKDYFPPNFYSEFLSGRKEYFFGAYQVAFWIHILVSPLVMFSGLWLLNKRSRQKFPRFHRRLGRVHVLVVLGLVAPSGLWMSFYALTGLWAGSAFALASCATFYCALQGWRDAVKRKFASHERWMIRCYLLLCSAIVLRALSGAATVLGVESLWSYPLFAWMSTLVPIAAFEVITFRSVGSDRKFVDKKFRSQT